MADAQPENPVHWNEAMMCALAAYRAGGETDRLLEALESVCPNHRLPSTLLSEADLWDSLVRFAANHIGPEKAADSASMARRLADVVRSDAPEITP